MPVTLPIEVYEVFEKGFGKEDAKKVVKSLEAVIGDEVVNKWHQTKEELMNELLKEVATKAELKNVRLEVLGRISKGVLQGLRAWLEFCNSDEPYSNGFPA
jgi:hypothetical protein